MSVNWEEASPTVLSTARDLIQKYHPSLEDAHIVFLYRSEAAVSSGRLTIGHAQKVSLQLKVLLEGADFIIWVSKPDWERSSNKIREALMDRELTHCVMDDGTASIRPHDIEEFHQIIDRHGLWNKDLSIAAEHIDHSKQLSLPGVSEVTLSSGGKTVTLSAEKLKKLSHQLR